jgi:hypothetical protein
MAKIAFILLCHKDPDAIVLQAQRLTATGDYVSIHFDARASAAHYLQIREALADNPAVVFAAKRVKCGWGAWSLVRATLNAVEAADVAFPDATHFYMLSGDCMSVKSAAYAHRFLDAHDRDYIESFDFFNSDWIKTGFKEERLIYRHIFNERTQKWLFYRSFEVQRWLGLKRRIPEDIEVQIGSQWWCLRRRTIEKILQFCRERRDVVRFFSTTWIPDETFFQTLVRHLVPAREIESRTLTFKMFSDYGMPVTFYNDQYDLLISQNYLFARKISPEATLLKDRLGALWDSDRVDFATSQEGEKLHAFLTGRGRIGKRYGTRFWERESTLGPDRNLYMLVCKKWHVAKRLLHAAADRLDIRGVEYLFDEASCPVPHLGGIERTLEKRNRHRRALMRMLFDYHDTDRLMICLDPGNIALMQDFMSDRANTRILELQCVFDDQYLVGHARRVGLATMDTPDDVIARMLPTLRHEFADESIRIREAEFPRHWRMRQDRSAAENALVLSDFFGTDDDAATELAATPFLFAD